MMMPKKIIRSSRKSLALVIDEWGDLIVRAPKSMSMEQINRFIEKKDTWIRNKQGQAYMFTDKYLSIAGITGEKLSYLGQEYTINLSDTNRVCLEDRIVYIPSSDPKADLITWLKEQAYILIKERVLFYSSIMSVEYAKVRLTEAKGRWGSCSANNNLNFAWRLIMCPQKVIDYVVVHELSHIKYKDHSLRFWQCVGMVLPDYKEQDSWLKIHRKIMNIV